MEREEIGGETKDKATCVCPFCENVLEMPAPWCAVCKVHIRYCVTCEEPFPKDTMICPTCGAECEE